jgi:hypothetical protein
MASTLGRLNPLRTRFAELLGQRKAAKCQDPAGETADQKVLGYVVDADVG